jgi:hypothetical protein
MTYVQPLFAFAVPPIADQITKTKTLGFPKPIHAADYIAFGAAFAFGIWWIALPRSVIAFYTWFCRGKAVMPGIAGVRIGGAIWVALLTYILISFFGKPK